MSASNRQAIINKTFRVLKKYYQPVATVADRSVLEHLLYACCLENAKHECVDEVLAKLEQNYFDWNEVRVTTTGELSEVMSNLPDAAEAAKRLKRSLQSVFETHYSFDIEFLRKQNIRKSISDLEALNGVTRFAVSYVAQNALGGHSIPLSQGVFAVLTVLGVISEADGAKRRVPGLERAVPKSKGMEFATLLHQLGVDFAATPFSARVRAILCEISPESKDRLPRRGSKKEAEDQREEPLPEPSQPPEASTTSKEQEPPASVPGKGPPKEAKPPDAGAEKTPDTAEADRDLAEKSKSATKRLSRKKPR